MKVRYILYLTFARNLDGVEDVGDAAGGAACPGWQLDRPGPISGLIFGPLFRMPLNREFCRIVRADFRSDFGSLYKYPFQMSPRASFQADIGAIFWAKKFY